MRNFYIESGFMKNIFVNEENIMASDENYETLEKFEEKFNSEKKSKLDTLKKVTYSQITKIILFREENGIQIFYNNDNSTSKVYLEFKEEKNFSEVLDFILSKRTDLKLSVEALGSKSAVVKPSLYAMAAGFICYGIVDSARIIESGEAVYVSGRRSGLKNLFVNISEILGFWGSIGLSAIVMTWFAYQIYSAHKSSKIVREIYI